MKIVGVTRERFMTLSKLSAEAQSDPAAAEQLLALRRVMRLETWVTVEFRVLEKDEPLPEGWHDGRT